jgi:GxxExxY protein
MRPTAQWRKRRKKAISSERINTDRRKINTDKMDTHRYKYGSLTEKIIRCAFEVHNNLGCGFLEKVYHRALTEEFKAKGLNFSINKSIKIFYKEKEVGLYIPDFIIENKVIVELKTVDFLTKAHIAQVINYLKATGYTVGLILNFNQPRLQYKRVVN